MGFYELQYVRLGSEHNMVCPIAEVREVIKDSNCVGKNCFYWEKHRMDDKSEGGRCKAAFRKIYKDSTGSFSHNYM